MGEPEVTFGDKIFLAGEFMAFSYLFEDFEENSIFTDDGTEVHGVVVDILSADSLAPVTPFNQVEMVEVTNILSVNPPLPSGTKVWMPTTPLL